MKLALRLAARVDIVVVYKVDRLTRSLTDFAKLVELFDAHQVSFVSITQSFNTTTSMGRLTLNILLSFAQFEREVIGERVRDKIAASKRKGMWMGGNCPLGYRTQAKKLVVIPEEAETVRFIFRRYLELGSTGLLLGELRDRGIKTKRRQQNAGGFVGGVWFGKGALTYLLKNRGYIGQIAHRGELHTAEHEAIVDRELFDAVQAKLHANARTRKLTLKASSYLLTGLLFDSIGNRMSPSHTLKKGVRYRYYVSQGVLQNRDVGEVARVSSSDLEAVITSFLQQRAPSTPIDIRECLSGSISRLTIRKGAIEVEMAGEGQTVIIPWHTKAARAEKGVAYEPSSPIGDQAKARQAALAAIGKSRGWLRDLIGGRTLADIAERDGRSERQIRILLNLAFLPPEQVRSILNGSKSVATITELARQVPVLWPELSSGLALQAGNSCQ